MAIHEFDTWRLRELVDEPLYCAAQTPEDLSEIIHYGSDDELCDSERQAKRLRYEAAGQRYLDGHRPRLLSASLRGSFDARSGWVNPWLPKSMRNRPLSPIDNQQQPIDKNRASAHERKAYLVQEAGRGETVPPTLTGSMSLQVPESSSAISYGALVSTPNVHIHMDKITQIQAWADNVETGLPECDQDFWNPLTKTNTRSHSQTQIRELTPTKTGWLKKTPLKRKRPQGEQQELSGKITKPKAVVKSTSYSAALCHKQPAVLVAPRKEASSRSVHRGFELATPSSLAEPPSVGMRRTLSGSLSDCEQLSTSGDTVCLQKGDCGEPFGRKVASQMDSGAPPTQITTNTYRTTDESHMQMETDEQIHRKDLDTCCESQVDNSFHYRVRHHKQKPNVTHREEGQANNHILTQTETPESSHHPDELITITSPRGLSQVDGADTAVIAQLASFEVGPESDISEEQSPPDESSVKDGQHNTQETNFQDASSAESLHKTDEISDSITFVGVSDNASAAIPTGKDNGSLQQNTITDSCGLVKAQRTTELTGANKEIAVEAEKDELPRPVSVIDELQTIAFAANQLSESMSTSSLAELHRPTNSAPSLVHDPEVCDGPSTPAQAEIASRESSAGAQHEDQDHQQVETALCSASSASANAKSLVPDQPLELALTTTAMLNALEGDISLGESAIRPSQQSPWASHEILGINDNLEPPTPSRHDPVEPDFILKSFSRFNTPSPQRRPASKSRPRNSTGQLRGILSMSTSQSPWASDHPDDGPRRRASHGVQRRVSFAPLPSDTVDEPNLHDMSSTTIRPASPPPVISVTVGDEDITDHFQRHFDSMKRKKSGVPHKQPLLSARTIPTSAEAATSGWSQKSTLDAVEASEIEKPESAFDFIGTSKQAETADFGTFGAQGDQAEPQSPWRQDSQSEMVDDVAAVMGNLDAFLDAWNVENEMQKATPIGDKENHDRDGGRNKTIGGRTGLQELSIWN